MPRHPAGALGNCRGFQQGVRKPCQSQASVMPYQALLTVTDSPDPSNLSGGAQCLPLGLPSLGLPCKKLSPVLVSSMARAFVTQMSQVSSSSLSPCQYVPHANRQLEPGRDTGELCGMGLRVPGKDASGLGFLHLKSKLSALTSKSPSLYCSHTYSNKLQKKAFSRNVRGPDTSMLI